MPPTRMTANPKRPSRYRPGKGQDENSESEYETEEEEVTAQKPKPAPPTSKVTGAFQEVSLSALKSGDLTSKAQEIDEDEFETEDEEETVKSKQATGPGQIQDEHQDGSSEAESGSEEEDDENDEDSDSSSDDDAPVKLIRPTFIRKEQRVAVAPPVDSSERDAAELEARRKEKADALIQEQLERNAELKAAEKKAWDDSDNEGIEGKTEAEVDDTDDIDPEAERAAWKLRELKRVKRTREQLEVAEQQREEIERRRNLTQEEREAEDAAHLAAQKEEREGKGKAGFMQRYFHKGAFFQDSEYAEEAGLKGRDIMGSKFVDQVSNRETLPEFMQIRDMAKLGRKGRTKYKDLRAEDTGRWADFGKPEHRRRDEGAGTGGMADVVDERFRPDDSRGIQAPSGANATRVSSTARRGGGRATPPRDAPAGPRGSKEQVSNGRRSYSRSRSPPRRRSRDRYRSRSRDRDRDRRKRSASPREDRRDSKFDKRVKVE